MRCLGSDPRGGDAGQSAAGPPYVRSLVDRGGGLPARSCVMGPSGRPAENGSIERQNDHRADDGADKASTLTRPVPADLLPEPSSENRADDAEQGGHDKPMRSGAEPPGDQARQKPDNDDPEPMKHVSPT